MGVKFIRLINKCALFFCRLDLAGNTSKLDYELRNVMTGLAQYFSKYQWRPDVGAVCLPGAGVIPGF